jgi:hypothetical protein
VTEPSYLLALQLPARVQQLAATANAVLFDFDRHNSYQFQTLRQSLHEAIGKGKTMPLRPHMHRYAKRQGEGQLCAFLPACGTCSWKKAG